MTDAPTVTVILAFRNGEPLITQQLEGLANQQTDHDWEVLLADNGSTDNSVAEATRFRDRLPGFRIVDASARKGKSYALNLAEREARGDVLLFVDHDDVVSPGYVDAMAKALTHSDLGAARLDHDTLNSEWPGILRGQTDRLCVHRGFLPPASGCGLGVKRKVFEELGGFDEDVAPLEDIDFSWRAQLLGYKLAFVPGALIHYRHRATVRAAFHQGYAYGRCEACLFMRFAGKGMPPRNFTDVISSYRTLAALICKRRNRAESLHLASRAGSALGRIAGSIHYRVLYV